MPICINMAVIQKRTIVLKQTSTAQQPIENINLNHVFFTIYDHSYSGTSHS